MNTGHVASPDSKPALLRSLGFWDLTAIGVNQVIGGAVFLVPAQIALLLGGWSPLGVLLIGLVSMPAGLCFAEVGSRFESTGGAYLYARAAFGRFAGLEVAWMQWFTRVASLASVVNGIVITVSPFYRRAAGSGRILLVLGITLTLMLVNLCGIRPTAAVVNFLTIAKLLPLLGFIAIALTHIHPSYYPPLAATKESAGAAALLLVFTFGGFDVVGVPAGEAKAPRRDVPLALITTIGVVTLILTSIQTLLMFTLPNLAHSQVPIADTARNFTGSAGALVVAAGAVISMLGNNHGQILSGSRTLFALAENGDAPAFLRRISPRHGTPYAAILGTTAAGIALALSGSFVRMAAISAVARLIAYVATAASVLALRRRDATNRAPAAHFRMPAGGTFPLVTLLTCVWILSGATREQLSAGATAMTAGAVLYFVARRARTEPAHRWRASGK
jgi:basic amino acid/polyamine antiporter, APA family